jgi:hypothetical protein
MKNKIALALLGLLAGGLLVGSAEAHDRFPRQNHWRSDYRWQQPNRFRFNNQRYRGFGQNNYWRNDRGFHRARFNNHLFGQYPHRRFW